MAEPDYKALAEKAMAEAKRLGPNMPIRLAEAQMYWSAYNAQLLDHIGSEMDRIARWLDELNETINRQGAKE